MENTFEAGNFESFFDFSETVLHTHLFSPQTYPTLAHEASQGSHAPLQGHHYQTHNPSPSAGTVRISIANDLDTGLQVAWPSLLGREKAAVGIGIGQPTLTAKEGDTDTML